MTLEEQLEQLNRRYALGQITKDERALLWQHAQATVGEPTETLGQAAGTATDAPSIDAFSSFQLPRNGQREPRARQSISGKSKVCALSLAGIAGLVFVVMVAKLLTGSENWTGGFALTGIFGGAATTAVGVGSKLHKSRWIAAGVGGGLSLALLGGVLQSELYGTSATPAGTKADRLADQVEPPDASEVALRLAKAREQLPLATPTTVPATPTPIPPLEERVKQSYRASVGFMEHAFVSGLTVTWDNQTSTLRIDLLPTNADWTGENRSAVGFVMTAIGETGIVANMAVWEAFPEVHTLIVSVNVTLTDKFGASYVESTGSITVRRVTGVKFVYEGLRTRARRDNKAFLCSADGYDLSLGLFNQIEDLGCLAQWGRIKRVQ